MEDSLLGFLWDIKGVILVSLLLLALATGISIKLDNFKERKAEKKYNHGICLDCGGNYEYFDVVGHEDKTCYIYKCNKCNNTVELTKLMKDK